MKTIEEVKKHLQALKIEAETELSNIPEVFNDLTQSENYNYYSGALETINNILEFIGEKEMGKWTCEVVQNIDGSYYANLTIDNKHVDGLPEYVDYNTLYNAIRLKTGICILRRKNMIFERFGRKKYAFIDCTQVRKDCRVKLSEFLDKTYQPKWED